jgi:uncharacterized protein involved in exopolysaccharide biosynthesis/Mrp family chromosome partitioning ATPase
MDRRNSPLENSLNPIFRTAESEDLTQIYDTRKLYLGIQRHLIVITLCILACTGLGGFLTYYYLTTFKADAAVLYKEDLQQTLPEGISFNHPSLITAVDLISLDANYQTVIAQLGLKLTVKDMQKIVSVPQPPNLSHLIHIIATNNNPNIAIDIVNTLAKLAVKRSQDFFSQQLQTELNNFKDQEVEITEKYNKELKNIEGFKQTHHYFEMTADYADLITQLTQTRSKLQSATLAYNSLLVEYENLKKATLQLSEQPKGKETSSNSFQSPGVVHLQQSLLEAKAKYAPDNPKIKILEDQLETFQKSNFQDADNNNGNDESELLYEKAGVNRQLTHDLIRMSGKVKAAQKMKEDLTQSLAELEKGIETLPKSQMEFLRLLKAKQTYEGQMDSLNKSIKTIQLMLNVPTGALEVYQLAERATPLRDSYLVKLIPLIGALVGLLLGIVFAIYIEMRDKKFRTLKQIEIAYTIPAIMLIPEFSFLTKKNSTEKMLYFVRSLAERIEPLAWAKLPEQHPKEPFSIGFISSIQSEGKSCVAYHLALYWHQVGKKVVFIETDTTYNLFAPNFFFTPLENYLNNQANLEDIIFNAPMARIKVGKKESFMKELIKSPKMDELMQWLRTRYDFILMDIPGVIETDYTINLAKSTDLQLFIIGSCIADKRLVDESLRDLMIGGVKPSGILLNRVLPTYIEDTRIKVEMERSKTRFFDWFKKRPVRYP